MHANYVSQPDCACTKAAVRKQSGLDYPSTAVLRMVGRHCCSVHRVQNKQSAAVSSRTCDGRGQRGIDSRASENA